MMERQRAFEFMKKILIVEDDEAIRTELLTLLRANGYLPVGIRENTPEINVIILQST